jgi:hypothetical protein
MTNCRGYSDRKVMKRLIARIANTTAATTVVTDDRAVSERMKTCS